MDVVAYVSKTLWHSRLGHSADQVIGVLQKELEMSKDSHVSPCNICHRAKQTREHFPLKTLQGYPHMFSMLKRLKQAPRLKNAKLVYALTKNGFIQRKFDYSLFVNGYGDTFVALLVYVDDIVITGSDVKQIEIHCLSQHMCSPLSSHLKTALSVLRYLKGSPGCGVQKSKKQATLSRSSTEAEYRCMVSATYEIIWICNILSKFSVTGVLPVEMYCDNISPLQLAANPVFHEKSKHFEIDLHLIREKVPAGVVKTI
ncbi:ribonuclease H-like domain-containing protein [Tanacetum coccineum]